jgi:hypothetical protein
MTMLIDGERDDALRETLLDVNEQRTLLTTGVFPA